MINIADAVILAGLVGLIGFLWHERFRMETLEEENEELWGQFAMMVDHITTVEEKVESIKDGTTDSKN